MTQHSSDSEHQHPLPASEDKPGGLRIPLPAVMMGLGLLAAGAHTEVQAAAVNDSYSMQSNSVLSGQNVTTNDTRDGNSYSVSLVSNVSNGTLSLQNTGVFTYTPNADFAGTDTFTYELDDFGGTTPNSIAQVSITVQAPQAVPTLGGAAAAGLGVAVGLLGLGMRRRQRDNKS
jgi:hypothetical protein